MYFIFRDNYTLPTCDSNFDTLPTCNYHRLCAVYPPLPHHYSNIEICKNSLLSRSKHSLSQTLLTPIRLGHQKSLSLTPTNHSLPSFMQIESRKTALFSCGKKTHSLPSCNALRFTRGNWDLYAWDRACKPSWGRSRLLLLCSVVAGRLGFCFLIFEI